MKNTRKRNRLRILLSMFKNIILEGLRVNKPSFAYKIIKGYIEAKYFGKKRIQYVEIMTTHACNAKCDHCSNAYYDHRGKRKLLTPEKVEDLIRQTAEMGIPVIVFLGGEPMLDPNIFRYIELAWRHGIMAIIGSNGQLFTEDNLGKLRDAHISNISITIYSTNSSENEKITRLPGYLENAIRAVKMGKALGLKMSLKTVVSRLHFENGEIYRIIDLAKSLDVWLSINPIVPTGAAHDNHHQDILTLEQQKELDNLVYENDFITTHLTSNYFGYGCPAGRAYLGVSAYGDVIPCFFMPFSYGNVWNETLAAIHQRMLSSKLFGEGAKTCVAAYDTTFINEVLAPCFNDPNMMVNIPAPIEKHPLFKKELNTLDI